MTQLEPFDALTTCERALRQVLTSVLRAKHGDGWEAKSLPAAKLEKWQGRAEMERVKREKRGVAQTSSNPLDYSEFYDLLKVLSKQWDLVLPCLGKKSETYPLLERFETLRDSVAHGRELLAHERDLMSGIAGEIRNKVTLFMSTQDPSGDYYARIEAVTDSFGFSVDAAKTLVVPHAAVKTKQVLAVGDIVTFRCQGSDSRGREISWHLRPSHGTATGESAIGNDVTLRWTVDPSHSGEQIWVGISMTCGGYSRWLGQHNGMAMFYYRVPPSFD